MKPSFALSLSSNGITLLTRASGGWRHIGTVGFDSADMDAELAALHAQGLEFDDPVQCKLILPNDQIRYLTLETGDISDETRRAEARLALADATPYELHELAFDISADGRNTHVAAVAYETLQEAEGFAQMHGFTPVSFVAQPEENHFLGEPFFGVAAAMADQTVTPDGIAVVDIGPAEAPKAEAEDSADPIEATSSTTNDNDLLSEAAPDRDLPDTDDAPTAETTETAPTADDLLTAVETETAPAMEGAFDAELAPQAELNPEETAAMDAGPAPDAAAMDDAKAEDEASAAAQNGPTDQDDAQPAEAEKPRAETDQPTTIETVTAQLAARAERALARDDLTDTVSPKTPTGLPDALDFDAVAELAAQNRSVTDLAPTPSEDTSPSKAAVEADLSSSKSSDPSQASEKAAATAATRAPTLSAVRIAQSTPGASAKAPVIATPTKSAAPAIGSAPAVSSAQPSAPTPTTETAAPVATRIAVPPAPAPLSSTSEPGPTVLGQIETAQIAVPADSDAAREAAAARAAYEAEKSVTAKPQKGRMTVRTIGGKPRFLGLMLTVVLVLFMAVVAAVAYWSTSGNEDLDATSAPLTEPATVLDLSPSQDDSATAISPNEAAPVQTPALEASEEEIPAAGDDHLTDTAETEPPLLSDVSDPAPQPETGAEVAAATDASPPVGTETANTPEQAIAPQATEEQQDPTLTETDTAVLDALHGQERAARPETPEAAQADAETSETLDNTTVAAEIEEDAEALADELAFLDPLATPDADDISHRTTYAATGVWQKVPQSLSADTGKTLTDLDDIYVASIDRSDLSHDTVALPDGTRFDTDLIQNALSSPLPEDSPFDLDDRGLVTATPEGTLNPDGITVYLGRPAKVPPTRPAPPQAAEPAPAAAPTPSIRPRERPAGAQDRAERARLGGLNLAELAQRRPRQRPEGLEAPEPVAIDTDAVEAAIAAVQTEEPDQSTEQAVDSSVVPRARPRNFDTLVARADRSSSAASASAPAVTAAAAATPRIPSSASVTREATQSNVIDLRKISLIGVSGSPSDRRALVRMPSGRVRRVKVGDTLDGGRVTAIDNERLLYQRRGRNHTLSLPKG